MGLSSFSSESTGLLPKKCRFLGQFGHVFDLEVAVTKLKFESHCLGFLCVL